jgi:hypothetical protein
VIALGRSCPAQDFPQSFGYQARTNYAGRTCRKQLEGEETSCCSVLRLTYPAVPTHRFRSSCIYTRINQPHSSSNMLQSLPEGTKPSYTECAHTQLLHSRSLGKSLHEYDDLRYGRASTVRPLAQNVDDFEEMQPSRNGFVTVDEAYTTCRIER